MNLNNRLKKLEMNRKFRKSKFEDTNFLEKYRQTHTEEEFKTFTEKLKQKFREKYGNN